MSAYSYISMIVSITLASFGAAIKVSKQTLKQGLPGISKLGGPSSSQVAEVNKPRLNSSSPRIFIVGDDSIFEEGITHLLIRGTGMQVSSAKYIDDPAFLEAITKSQPDIILLNESALLDSAHFLELLFSSPSLAGSCVIVIRLTDILVDVYKMPKKILTGRIQRQQQVIVTKHEDLVDIVRGQVGNNHG